MMKRRSRGSTRPRRWQLPASLLLVATVVAPLVVAGGPGAAAVRVRTSAKHASIPRALSRLIDAHKVPMATGKQLHKPIRQLPVRTRISPRVYAQRKAAALRNPNAPGVAVALGRRAAPARRGVAATPTTTASFPGMANSTAICPPNGCQPPDMGLAVSSRFVVQAVNTSVAIYSTNGVLQAGWPKEFTDFFGIPEPTPTGCDPAGTLPFAFDPRAFYDHNDNRFFVVADQIEGGFGVNSCDFLTKLWVAVSASGNPTGSWHIYSFDMSLGTTNGADYPMIGFDTQAFYFSANMFDQDGLVYQYDEVFATSKRRMELGQSVTPSGFFNLTVCGVSCFPADTVQPVLSLAHKVGPQGEFLVSSFNGLDPFGNDCFTSACTGAIVWAFSNPLSQQGQGQQLTGAFVNTNPYTFPPQANNPGACDACVDTLDNRISGTPVYEAGQVWFAHETGVNNGTQVVPAIQWFQMQPSLDDGFGACTLCVSIDSVQPVQDSYFAYAGDGAAFFGTLMPDAEGNLFMGFEFSGVDFGFDPSSAYAARRATEEPNQFEDGGTFLVASTTPTFDFRWGDYEAMSWTGYAEDKVWMALEHSCAGTGDWCTQIARTSFTLTQS